MDPRPIASVLVKPAGPDCNLYCDYCFYIDKQRLFPGSRMRMSDEVLEVMITQLFTQPIGSISIGWQGGEPTLMGIPFYQRAVELMDKYGHGKNVANSFQTNGLLIDQQWARFFRDYHFLIGLSIDGPEHIHDHYRKTRNGSGSFQKSLEAANHLLNAGVEVNVLTVLNDYSVQFPDEIYEFNKVNGLNYMQFIPCVEHDACTEDKVAPYTVSSEAYGSFLCKVFDLWLSDFSKEGIPTTSIRFFESLLFQYAGFQATECTLLQKCGTYLVIEHNGDVYPCDFFVDSEWKLGNLLETPIEELGNSSLQSDFVRLKSKIPLSCRLCKWKSLCNGGCPKDRGFNPIASNRNYFCDAYKTFFSYADARLAQLALGWKKNNNMHHSY